MISKALKVAVVAAVSLTPFAARAAEYDWRLQTFWSGGSSPQKIVEKFADRVRLATDGRINIQVLPNNTFVPHTESLQAVGTGLYQMQYNTPCYSSGLDPAFGLLCELNAGYENAYQFIGWYYKRDGLQMARDLYANYGVHFIGPVAWGAETIPSKIEIRTLEDFKGVRIRMPEGPSSELFRSIGASPVTVPGSEVYTSLDKGIISATDWGTLSMNDSMGLHDIAKYEIYPGIHSVPMGDVSINADVWKDLPEDLKAILEDEVRILAIDMIQTFESDDAAVVANAAAEGLTLVRWSDEERRKFRAAAQKIWASLGEKSDRAQAIYESQVNWLKDLNLL